MTTGWLPVPLLTDTTLHRPSATCYKTVRAYAECRDALSKAANCYQQNRSLFAAAKCYEQGILMSKELGDLATVITLVDRAAQLYQVRTGRGTVARVRRCASAIPVQPRPSAYGVRKYASGA